MPQTTPERRARWPGADAEACAYLEKQGYVLGRDWCWRKPNPDHKPTKREKDAVVYLIEEWDFGGIVMRDDWVRDMIAFHKALDIPILSAPVVPTEERVNLRVALLEEEFQETIEAIADENIVEIADGLADLITVAIGAALEYGIDLRPVWDEVWRTNMAKKGGPIREDGKHLKPEGWKPPDIAAALKKGKL